MKNYLNERHPKSNSNSHIHYYLLIAGRKAARYDTVDDVETAIHQARHNNLTIKKAVRFAYGSITEFIPETASETTQRENFEHCKHIAKNVEAYADGKIYRCPECGEEYEIPDTVGDKFKCPHCHEVNELDDFEQLSLYDYFTDILDIDYTVNYRKEYKSCRIMVAYGGPTIYIDTDDGKVKLYWWTDYSEYRLLSDVIDSINDWAEEYYNCL